jgi:hypothetical protein
MASLHGFLAQSWSLTGLLADLTRADPAYPDAGDLWGFLLPGYLFTIAIETPVLMVGLSRRHSWRRRLGAGLWLTACTYPIVVIVLPYLIGNYVAYLAVAETFAPLAECFLFSLAFHRDQEARRNRIRDWIAIILANLASFLFGQAGHNLGWF